MSQGSIECRQVGLDGCAGVTGVVVVIDVLRAFTSAAYALDAGAPEIVLVGETDTAFALQARMPGALLMGEINGAPIPGFDFGNSPAPYLTADLRGPDGHGRRLIQRTTHGTQGVVRATAADPILTASFVVAAATAAFLRRLNPPRVTFVVTGWEGDLAGDGHPPVGAWGDEDAACADYLTALLQGESPDPQPYLDRVWNCPTASLFRDPARTEYPVTDLDLCTALDRFAFALPVTRQDGLHILRRSDVPHA